MTDDGNQSAVPTGVRPEATGDTETAERAEQADDRPGNRPEDDVDVDVKYDDIASNPAVDDEPNVVDPKVGF